MQRNPFNKDGTYTAEYWETKAVEAETIAECMHNKSAKATMQVVAQSYRLLAWQARTDQRKLEKEGSDNNQTGKIS